MAQRDAFTVGEYFTFNSYGFTGSKIVVSNNDNNVTVMNSLYTSVGSTRYPSSKYLTIYNGTYA